MKLLNLSKGCMLIFNLVVFHLSIRLYYDTFNAEELPLQYRYGTKGEVTTAWYYYLGQFPVVLISLKSYRCHGGKRACRKKNIPGPKNIYKKYRSQRQTYISISGSHLFIIVSIQFKIYLLSDTYTTNNITYEQLLTDTYIILMISVVLSSEYHGHHDDGDLIKLYIPFTLHHQHYSGSCQIHNGGT